ncbi:MAG: hypothetical protein JNL48_22000 [Acidobacteria bacterium]|nr:hypothetical protein [Acidobacteriota bacterium]
MPCLPALAAIVVAATTALAAAQTPTRPAGSLTDVTGVWTMLVEGHQIGLELEQKGTTVEGVMLAMGRRVLLVGEYVERTLTLRGERPDDGAGLSHGAEPGKDAPGPIVAAMKDDGTLEGELSTSRGRSTWTGERLKTP